MIRTVLRACGAAILAILLSAGHAVAAGGLPEIFYGKYEGMSVDSSGREVAPRELNVEIAPKKDGFVVSWSTTISKADGEKKTNAYSILFRPTRRDGIYASAMKVDVFGALKPLDPIAGDPYVWARVRDRTLSVYALLIDETGEYELQTYDRTLTDGGMDLRFSRIRGGMETQVVTGSLQRVSG